MTNLYTYTCADCGFTGVFREDHSKPCPCCRAPMKELSGADVTAMLAMIDAVMGDYHDEDIEAMAVEMADKAKRRAGQ